jgi:hypothetical protein
MGRLIVEQIKIEPTLVAFHKHVCARSLLALMNYLLGCPSIITSTPQSFWPSEPNQQRIAHRQYERL